MYLRRAIVRRRPEQSAAAVEAYRAGRNATIGPAAGRRHRYCSKTRRRTPNTRLSHVQFGPPR